MEGVRRALRALKPASLALYPFIISLMVHLNPSGAPPPSPFGGFGEFALAAIVTTCAFVALRYFGIWRPGEHSFGARLALMAVGGFTLTTILGMSVHRDYLSMYYIEFLSFLIGYFEWLKADPAKERGKALKLAVYLFLIAGLAWLVLVCYATVTRDEPRWAESIAYNAYVAACYLVFILSFSEVNFEKYRRLKVTQESLLLGDFNLTELMPERRRQILKILVAKEGRHVPCRELQKEQRQGCASCAYKAVKITECPGYRYVYNEALFLSKFLEAFRIGRVEATDARSMGEYGWRVLLDKDVELVGDDEASRGALPSGDAMR